MPRHGKPDDRGRGSTERSDDGREELTARSDTDRGVSLLA
jgi:hypothetical protein